ncbi:methyl-accepting chemotaxis protein [Bacillus sp. FJAT-44742]|uniref:methyl-accepting chemotaxis protein n=1 Tax=Bacillus sp. FJAT-44742 TaxID=2014005 RepID=UPI000C23B1EE|nr:methyl-accepting chemotaxis protein [Bacillus sp. FJAT-44742]
MKSFINKLKLGTKLNVLIVAILLCFSTVIGFVVQGQITNGIERTAVEKAQSDLALGYSYIDAQYPGPWQVEDGVLFKGDVEISNNFDLVDEVGEMTDGTVTIFLEDTRVTTNVINNGERAVGTQASQEVAHTVLEEGSVYTGPADVAGVTYQTAYQPIYDAEGETIGMWYVGASQEILDEIIGQSTIVFLLVLVAGTLVSAGVVLLFSRRITKRLSGVSEALASAGEGDFTTALSDSSKDEIGSLARSYNTMKESLRQLVSQVTESSQQVAASSEQLSASAQETNAATEEISSSIQEMAAGAEEQLASANSTNDVVMEISTGMKQIAGNIQEINDSSQQASSKAEHGREVIEQSVSQMKFIFEKTNDTSSMIDQLGKKSKKIGDIVSLITAISDQTNLLALNAAIEAARAGEHGKGFAVVAEEVRKLAEQSGESSKQISEMIQEIQKDIQKSVESMSEGKQAVNEGADHVNRAGSSFKDISEAIQFVSTQMEEVSAAVQQISASTETMSSSVQETAKVAEDSSGYTQEVAASAEEQNASMQEITTAATTLAEMAEELQDSVKTFKL